MAKSMIIIGAGIAGMATGCYAQMNGYETRIFERHTLPGGVCTGWKRKGYTFDGCIHHLAGSGPKSNVHRVWQELGALQDLDVVFHETLTQIEGPEGEAFTVYTDLDRLEAHMKEIAPEDADAIEAYVRAARRFFGFDVLGLPMATAGDFLKLLPLVPHLVRSFRVNLGEYAERFTNPFLRKAFRCVQYDFEEVPVGLHFNFLAGVHNETLGWPIGGGLAFSAAIARRYEELGGEIHYRADVEKVLVEEGRAAGVRLADGTEHRADVVVSAADGYTTLFKMLEGKYLNDKFRRYYADPPDRQEMNVHVCFGVNRDMRDEPQALVYFLEEPVTLTGKERDRLDVEIYNFDPTLAPEGKTPVKVLLDGSYSRWKALREEGRDVYDAAKVELAQQVLDALEPRFPGIGEQVEVVDVATPVTTERFLGAHHGAQAWGLPGGGIIDFVRGMGSTLPGLESFYMVGQWVGGIGISTAAIGGRNLVKKLCKEEGGRFVTTVAG